MSAASHPRVVSLIASATETLHALDGGSLQVARSHECDWPPEVLSLPQITSTNFKVAGASSREIDASVKSLVQQGLAVYDVDAEALQRLSPDIILTQDQCEVCAVSLADVQRAVAGWTQCQAQVLSLKPHTLEDVYGDNLRIAAALGRPQAGERLNAQMQARFDRIAHTVAGRPKPAMAFIEWIDPPMSGGHWMPQITSIAGATSLFGTIGGSSPWITLDEIAAADPDIILVAPCGYELAKTGEEMHVLDANPAWQGLRAVNSGQVFIADGNAFFNRPGPRLVESAEIIAEIAHPEVASYGHMGKSVLRHAGKGMQGTTCNNDRYSSPAVRRA